MALGDAGGPSRSRSPEVAGRLWPLAGCNADLPAIYIYEPHNMTYYDQAIGLLLGFSLYIEPGGGWDFNFKITFGF